MKVKFSDIDVFLEPGELCVSAEPKVIKTILGSCVAVCLFDRKSNVGGMNHYVLPQPGGEDPAIGRYGTSSIRLLLAKMQTRGGAISKLKAGIYGGAHPLGGSERPQVGAANREVALQMMREHGIPVVEEDTGGELGRRIFFDTGTGKVIVSLIERNPSLWAGTKRGGRS